MRRDRLLVLPVLLLASSALRAQSFNLDVGDNLLPFPVPLNSYGGAAAQWGVWNNVYPPFTTALLDIGGVASGVGCTSSISSAYYWPAGLSSLDDQVLMDDIQAISQAAGTAVWTFTGLANGSYVVYTYAWAPNDANARTSVDVPGSGDGQQLVGGSWTGSPHVFGVTYALHHVAVTNGTLIVNCAGALGTSGSVNGFQIVQEGSTFTSFCAGDGSAGGVPCPCNNFGASGHGCENSASTGGAQLVASGSINPDTVLMQSSGELGVVTSILLQGTSVLTPPVFFGDGTRCIGGILKRLYVVAATAGVATFPPAGALPISQRSAALGDPIAPGTQRHYQAYYRDSSTSFCLPSPFTYNISNAVTVNW